MDLGTDTCRYDRAAISIDSQRLTLRKLQHLILVWRLSYAIAGNDQSIAPSSWPWSTFNIARRHQTSASFPLGDLSASGDLFLRSVGRASDTLHLPIHSCSISKQISRTVVYRNWVYRPRNDRKRRRTHGFWSMPPKWTLPQIRKPTRKQTGLGVLPLIAAGGPCRSNTNAVVLDSMRSEAMDIVWLKTVFSRGQWSRT